MTEGGFAAIDFREGTREKACRVIISERLWMPFAASCVPWNSPVPIKSNVLTYYFANILLESRGN
ncbi:hypothetical protein CO660_23410 [Rhizobium sp. L9]|nr:hypothetical protein CO660_23410 [Rhizobium sp. L9]